MANLKGTKTEENLQAAFAGESQAHTKYQYFALKAKEEGYVQIHDIFMDGFPSLLIMISSKISVTKK